MTCTLVLVQPGDLRHYAENPDALSFEVPAVFVTAESVDIGFRPGDRNHGVVYSRTRYRMVLVEEWEQPDQVTDNKIACAEELAQTYFNEPALNGEASIPDYTVLKALPVAIELEPPEDALVSQNQARQLWAVAVTVDVLGYANR